MLNLIRKDIFLQKKTLMILLPMLILYLFFSSSTDLDGGFYFVSPSLCKAFQWMKNPLPTFY